MPPARRHSQAPKAAPEPTCCLRTIRQLEAADYNSILRGGMAAAVAAKISYLQQFPFLAGIGSGAMRALMFTFDEVDFKAKQVGVGVEAGWVQVMGLIFDAAGGCRC
jgi:hypothetical protein